MSPTIAPAAALGRCGVGQSRFPQSAGPGQSLPGSRTSKGRVRETPTPGCAGLRPACFLSRGKGPLAGSSQDRPRHASEVWARGIARQKSGPEARAPREPHLTCKGGSRTAPTDLIDASQLLEGSLPNPTRCGVPSERLISLLGYPGLHPGLVCAAPSGRKLTRPSCLSLA